MGALLRNWRTTACGVLALVAALPTLGVALPAWLVTAGAVATGLGHVLATDAHADTPAKPGA